MESVLELAGWCAAEAVVNLAQNLQSSLQAQGPALLPFLVVQKGAERKITVLTEASPKIFEDIDAVLQQLSPSELVAVLVKDGYLTIDGHKSDALILEGHQLVLPRKSVTLAIPYTRQDTGRGFVLGRTKLVSNAGFDIDGTALSTAFAHGRETHTHGAAIWQEHS